MKEETEDFKTRDLEDNQIPNDTSPVPGRLFQLHKSSYIKPPHILGECGKEVQIFFWKSPDLMGRPT